MIEGYQRRNQRPVDKWQRAELLANRVPVATTEELETKCMPGEGRARHQFVDDENQHAEHGQRRTRSWRI